LRLACTARVWAGLGWAAYEKVDVDAVGVVLYAHGDDGLERVFGFAPGLALHGARVVDQEDGVEAGEERIRVVCFGASG